MVSRGFFLIRGVVYHELVSNDQIVTKKYQIKWFEKSFFYIENKVSKLCLLESLKINRFKISNQ